jgi:hypothetical protein
VSAPLNASATTVGTLLSGSVLQVPAYQREYAWEEAQVSEFWSDLSRSVDRGPYFLGLIILTGEDKRKQIVDGQQRLLTITLLAAALRHAAITIGRRALADRLHSTLLRSMDYTTDEVLPRIILTDPRANETLQSIIDDDEIDEDSLVTSGSSSERLWDAYKYLRDALHKDDDKEAFRQLGAWAEFINEQLYVAVFEHPDEAAAYSVFEVVNTRGRQLTTADLLKNHVLRRTPIDLRESRYVEWSQMAEKFEQLGGQNFVQYIRHVVNLKSGYVLPKELYNYVSRRGDYADAPPLSVEELMTQLQLELPLYLQLVDPTLDGPADTEALGIFVALNELGITAVRPLMLAINHTDNATAGMLRVLQLIVKKMVVGNLGASSVERKFADAAQVVYRTSSWPEGLKTLQEMDHSRGEFAETLSRRSYNRSILTFIHRSIAFRTMTPESTGTLQYIRPRQAGSATWSGFGDDEQTFWGSTLGNTVLVNIDRRPRGASTWAGVQQHLLPRAINHEARDLLEGYDVWKPEAVEEVGTKLAEVAASVWY